LWCSDVTMVWRWCDDGVVSRCCRQSRMSLREVSMSAETQPPRLASLWVSTCHNCQHCHTVWSC